MSSVLAHLPTVVSYFTSPYGESSGIKDDEPIPGTVSWSQNKGTSGWDVKGLVSLFWDVDVTTVVGNGGGFKWLAEIEPL